MFLPSRRWLLGAAGLAALALPALWWPEAAGLLVAADLLWLGALAVDLYRVYGFDWEAVEVTREAPPAFSVGRAMPVTYRWRHRLTRTLALRVREAFPDPLTPLPGRERTVAIPPRRAIDDEVVLMPARRGKAGGGLLTLRALGPWGLVWRQGRLDLPWQATVYPNLVGASLRALATQAQRRREAGFRSVRRIGEGRMFESLKEWVPGEDTRTIDWKATARRGKVMARCYEDERRQVVLVVLDAGRLLTAEVDGRPRLEAVVEAALHLAYSAVEHDDNIGLLVFADQIQQYVPPARGRRALRAVLDALAAVEGRLVEPNYPAAFAYLAARSRKRALTVLFTDVIDRTASEALVAQVGSLRPRHLPLAVTLRDPSLERLATRRPATEEAAFERAAAEELLQSREEALTDMRRRGVLVLDVPPAAASRAVVEQYNLLKRRGVL
ncbi:MAG TPA: DUF58 domain-containing protein [Gemmatimonadales bacterium]|jgi:uncharacterized protein (DUF58 family)|nr:DUF58 domain-containing protein [Gemmatimonadales bacterium]